MRRFLPLLILLALMTTAGGRQRGASITLIAPTFGAAGTTVSIRGAGFSGFETGSLWVKELASEPPPGAVEFNGMPGDVIFWQDDLITVKVPNGASTGPVRVVLSRAGIALTGADFDVYYSKPGATPARPPGFAAPESSRSFDGEARSEFGDRRLYFDDHSAPFYSNPWFSALSPGERTFLGEHGAVETFLFGNPFTLGRSRSFSRGGGFFGQPRGFGRSGFAGFGSEDLFFRDFFFHGSPRNGVRPSPFFFNGNRLFSFRNEGRIFRR